MFDPKPAHFGSPIFEYHIELDRRITEAVDVGKTDFHGYLHLEGVVKVQRDPQPQT